MRAVVVYESMYGNTRAVAEAVADGLRPVLDVVVVPVGRADPAIVEGAGLLVVGGPTHVHGMTRRRSREMAAEVARKPGSTVVLEEGAGGPGVREWMASLGHVNVYAAAFDTRAHGPKAFTGQASKGISRELGRHSAHLLTGPESFLVTKENSLEEGEEQRARRWGEQLAADVAAGTVLSAGGHSRDGRRRRTTTPGPPPVPGG
jgi:flavodoxin